MPNVDPAPVPSELWHLWLPLVLGAVAVYLLLPRPRNYPRPVGCLIAAAAILVAGWLLVRAEAANPETILFYAFSFIAIVSAGAMLAQSNPVHAALAFALVVLSTCGLFLLQAAPFLMAATIIVYAGAIVVTFLFVIMLAQQAGRSDADHRSREPLLATVAGFVLLGALLYLLHVNYDTRALDRYLSRIHEAAGQDTKDDMLRVLEGEEYVKGTKKEETFFSEFGKVPMRPPGFLHRPPLSEGLPSWLALSTAWVEATMTDDVEGMRKVLVKLETDVTHDVRDPFGSMKPGANRPLSPYSVAGSDLPGGQVAGPAPGRLPAENTAYLGRVLFTDYLVAVELAGTLLLIAAIGAIAITHRRSEATR